MPPSSNLYCTNMEDTKFDLESGNPIVRESNQTNPRIIEKILVSVSTRETWGFRGLPPEKFSKITCSRTSENALMRSRRHVYITNLHPEVENAILFSNLYWRNLKQHETLIFKKEIL